jgi:hypothetical protein
MTHRDGSDEDRARPWCRCGHYSHEHRNAERPEAQACYLCDCPAIRPRRAPARP